MPIGGKTEQVILMLIGILRFCVIETAYWGACRLFISLISSGKGSLEMGCSILAFTEMIGKLPPVPFVSSYYFHAPPTPSIVTTQSNPWELNIFACTCIHFNMLLFSVSVLADCAPDKLQTDRKIKTVDF